MLGFDVICGRQTHTLSLQLLITHCLLLFEVEASILLLPLLLRLSLFVIVDEDDHDVLRQACTAIALTDSAATTLSPPRAGAGGSAALTIEALPGLAPPGGAAALVALLARARRSTLGGQDTLIVAPALLGVEERVKLATEDLLSHELSLDRGGAPRTQVRIDVEVPWHILHTARQAVRLHDITAMLIRLDEPAVVMMGQSTIVRLDWHASPRKLFYSCRSPSPLLSTLKQRGLASPRCAAIPLRQGLPCRQTLREPGELQLGLLLRGTTRKRRKAPVKLILGCATGCGWVVLEGGVQHRREHVSVRNQQRGLSSWTPRVAVNLEPVLFIVLDLSGELPASGHFLGLGASFLALFPVVVISS